MKSIILFLISLFTINIHNVDAYSLIPGGENIVFEVYNNGLIITSTYTIYEENYNPSRDSDINKGDIIVGMGKFKITDVKSFKDNLRYFEDNIPLIIKRKGKVISRNLKLIKVGDAYKTGLYVKERIMGIGTVSFYDPERNLFACLGHEIYDQDSQTIIDLTYGKAYLEEVKNIVKSENYDVGNKEVDLDFEEYLGQIERNTKCGIYGSIEEIPSSYQPLEVAKIEEIKLGKAEILTTISSKVEIFDIEIIELKDQKEISPKGITFEIKDKELISKTGGIVKGMSGSPIIQNNKLIGAISHVKTSNVKVGYGLYMEFMLQESFN